MDFSVTTPSATSTSSSTPLCKGGALRLGHFSNISLAVLVQEVQSFLEVLGITVVAGGEIILKIHLEVAMLIHPFCRNAYETYRSSASSHTTCCSAAPRSVNAEV
jgi:hypothetical protein